MKKINISLILNIINVLLVTTGTIMIFTGIRFTGDDLVLETRSFNMFKYYTVDSNIILGISSFILVIYEILLLKNKIKKIPNNILVIKHIGVVGVTLTFLVTLLFLAPTISTGFFSFLKKLIIDLNMHSSEYYQ